HYTNIMEAMWSQAAIVRYHVRAKDDSKADESYAKLLNTFKDQKTLAKEVFQIADIYTEVGNTAKAIELAEYTIEKWPDSEYKLDAQKSIVKAQFGNDDYVAVGVSLDKLIADSKDNSELARILFDFGDEYYEKAFNKEIEERPQKTVIYIDELKPPNSKVINYYSCAQTVWQKLIDRFPDSDFTGEAMFMTGEMNRAIKQYERAIEYYSNFIDKWPKHEIAWIAQDRVISLFREMKFTGKISEFEGDILLVAAQEKLLQQFPDCPIVENIKKDMSVNKKRAAFHESLKNKKVRNIRGKQEQEGGSR
ncbi:MAG: tetratricopeptide repeat protein, partial [Sedimentisphaerales bacterium]|nr:tetratricopeptide repeat protein [Sedimentisphaerales bacterium]